MIRVLFFIFAMSAQRQLHAQQNLFNVPSGEITKEGRLFFQEQVNVSATTIQSNTTIDYGITEGLEIGLNVFFLNVPTAAPLRLQTNATQDSQSAAPLVLGNFQKGFSALAWLTFSTGMQAGGNAGAGGSTQFAYLAYGTAVLRAPRTHMTLHLGAYHGNIAYNGSGSGFFMGGAEIPVLLKRFHLVGDMISGTHANAVFVPGGVFFFNDHTALSVGWQHPFPGSATEHAIVFELSLY